MSSTNGCLIATTPLWTRKMTRRVTPNLSATHCIGVDYNTIGCLSRRSQHNAWCASVRRARCSDLVPGGRWLLATGYDPCLHFHDLDSPNGQRRILIRPQYKLGRRVAGFVVDETNTTPSNVDMFIALNHQPIDDQFGRLSIWRITSTPDDTLVAHYVKSFHTSETNMYFKIDLRGEFFARCANVDPKNWGSLRCIDVYDLQRSSTLVHHKATIVFGQEAARAIRILPRRRILAFERGIVKIYSIDSV